MVSPVPLAVATGPLLGGVAVAVALAAIVYWDAGRADVGSPARWAALVFATTLTAAATYAAVPSVPIPGLLVVVLAGPAVYALERDDAQYDDAPDPTVLPDQPREGADDEE